jgi:hypothetical protein
VPQLLGGLQVAHSCHFEGVETQLLDSIAAKLATAGTCVSAGMQPVALEALDSSTLAQLLFRLAQCSTYRPPPILEARPAAVGSTGGFTFAIFSFSKQRHECASPWVEVGGFEWRLRVHPEGFGNAITTYLSGECVRRGAHCKAPAMRCAHGRLGPCSAPDQLFSAPHACSPAFLEWNGAAAAAAGVASACASFVLTVIDQREGGQDSATESAESMTFSTEDDSWGWDQVIPLSRLRAAARSFLARDRLLLRVDITVHSFQRAPPPPA